MIPALRVWYVAPFFEPDDGLRIRREIAESFVQIYVADCVDHVSHS
jgi:hypothetical protein